MLDRALVIASAPDQAAPLSRMFREIVVMTPDEVDAAAVPACPTVAVLGLSDEPELMGAMVDVVTRMVETSTLIMDSDPAADALATWTVARADDSGLVVLTRRTDGPPSAPGVALPVVEASGSPADEGIALEAIVQRARNQQLEQRITALEAELATTSAKLKVARKRLKRVRTRLRERNRRLEELRRTTFGAAAVFTERIARGRRRGQAERGTRLLVDISLIVAGAVALAALVVLVPLATHTGLTGGLVTGLTLVVMIDLTQWLRYRRRLAATGDATKRLVTKLERLRRDLRAQRRSAAAAARLQAEHTSRLEQDLEQLTASATETARSVAAIAAILRR